MRQSTLWCLILNIDSYFQCKYWFVVSDTKHKKIQYFQLQTENEKNSLSPCWKNVRLIVFRSACVSFLYVCKRLHQTLHKHTNLLFRYFYYLLTYNRQTDCYSLPLPTFRMEIISSMLIILIHQLPANNAQPIDPWPPDLTNPRSMQRSVILRVRLLNPLMSRYNLVPHLITVRCVNINLGSLAFFESMHIYVQLLVMEHSGGQCASR